MKLRNYLTMTVVCGVMPLVMAGTCDKLSAVSCPQAKTYSDAFLVAAGNELDAVAPQAPHIVTMMNDYDVTLEAIRYCIKQARAAAKKKG